MRNEEAFWKSIEETESHLDQKLTQSQKRHLLFLMQQGDEVSKERASEIEKRHKVEMLFYRLQRRTPEGIQQLKDEYKETHGYDADRCKNCDYKLEAQDKYCRCCGAKVEEDEDEALEEIWYLETIYVQMEYGPLAVGKYVCDSCGHKWDASPKDKQYFCPKCGKDTVRCVAVTKSGPLMF